MEYELFGEIFAVDRELPFPVAEGAEDPVHRVEPHGELEDAIDLERLGELQVERCGIQYGGWLHALRPAERFIWYQKRVLGDFDLPFEHVVERSIFPIYATLLHDSYVAMHGSAVVFDGRAWLVTGDTKSGKSTTGYELMHRFDTKLASDEAAVVDIDEKVLHSGAPTVRLAREAGSIPEAVEEGEVHPELEKRWFRLDRECLAEGSFPLAGVIYLDPVDDAGPELFELEPFRGSESLTGVIDQCFDFETAPKRWRKRRFSNAARLVDEMDVYRCRYGRSEDGSATHVEPLWEAITAGG